MHKYSIGILPQQITDLFASKSEGHNYNTRQTHYQRINAGWGEIVYKLFSFHGVHNIKSYLPKIAIDTLV